MAGQPPLKRRAAGSIPAWGTAWGTEISAEPSLLVLTEIGMGLIRPIRRTRARSTPVRA
jgi:hypothetical protein